jgi:hypothetical protein
MKIKIKIKKNRIDIILLSGRKILDQVNFPEDRNLSEKLLPSLDAFLRNNRLHPENIEKMELKADIGDSFTTYRIAKTVVDTFNWAASLPPHPQCAVRKHGDG